MSPHDAAMVFLSPPRSADPVASPTLQAAERFVFAAASGRLVTRRLGSGPKVLLVHGWGGRAEDLDAFIPPLVEAGFEVICPDLPGHGDSDGTSVSIPQAADALVQLQEHIGPFHALVAHSVGSAAAVHAMGRGLAVGRAALIAPPARYTDYARGFAAQLGLSAREAAEMIECLHGLGHDLASVDSPVSARQLRQPALVVHSSDDRVVPVADGVEIGAAWSGARMLLLDGLGHRRIVKSPEVVARVVSFVRAEEAGVSR